MTNRNAIADRNRQIAHINQLIDYIAGGVNCWMKCMICVMLKALTDPPIGYM